MKLNIKTKIKTKRELKRMTTKELFRYHNILTGILNRLLEYSESIEYCMDKVDEIIDSKYLEN